MDEYCSLFEYIYIYIFCLWFYWNLAEDNNGVVNAEDETAQHEELEKVDKMEEGWYSHQSFVW